jgi:hypothetical protein
VKIAALVMWVLTAAAGCYLLAVRVADGGLRRPPIKVTRFPTALFLSHPVLALVALAAWVQFLVTSRAMYAWSAFAVLVVVALLGFVLLTRWLIGRGGKHARGAERPLPYTAMLVHGAVALLTFVLVLLAALAVSR